LSDLRADEFPKYFSAAHGLSPFPWQECLAQRVFAQGWPDALAIPTGAGKTAAIDIALFHLALEAERPANRRAPVRILFVVDRRLIVDDAYARAKQLRKSWRMRKTEFFCGSPIVCGCSPTTKTSPSP
jgi:CRISPR-associated endonuclease/helicase Cas3